MKVLFLCGVFAKENEEEIIENAKYPVENSANTFQKKLILGFKDIDCDVSVLSAPFIGSYPNASKMPVFRGFKKTQTEYSYVHFNNIWGIRNFSRAKSLKKALNSFIEDNDCEKKIVIYSPHTPFLEAAVYAKKRDANIKICLVVPDLPQYMNLRSHVSLMYKIGKKIDIAKFNKLNEYVDSYMMLTDVMKEKIDIQEKPYIVTEGIVDIEGVSKIEEMKRSIKKDSDKIYVVYTGKMDEKFGVKDLVDAFMRIDGAQYRLVLCGSGDAEEYIKEKGTVDSRIEYLGQLTAGQAQEWMYKADVLVNPRKNDEEYTKYSFPSKNIDYLLTGKPVVGYMLDGMPEIYREYMHIVEDDKLSETILNSVDSDDRNMMFCEYAKQRLYASEIAKRILALR